MSLKEMLKKGSLLGATALLLGACGTTGTANTNSSETNTSADSSEALTAIATTDSELTASDDQVDKSLDWENEDYETIDVSTQPDTITSSGVYEITGTLDDGSLEVNVDKTQDTGTVYLVLNNVDISSSDSAPINITEAKNVEIILADGSQNTINQEAITTEDTEFPSAAVFSRADLFIVGEGELSVTTAFNDGIASKDDLNVESGNITINAASDGLVGKDSVEINGGTIEISAGKDGIKATNEEEEGQGYIEINDGDINITQSDEGIEGVAISINGGIIAVTSADDGINVSNSTTGTVGDLIITNGEITLSAGGDGADSNGGFTMSGGTLTIDTTLIGEANTPVDVDGEINVSGGSLVDTDGNEIDYSMQMGAGAPGEMGVTGETNAPA